MPNRTEQLNIQREAAKSAILRICSWCSKIDTNSTSSTYVEAQAEQLEKSWSSFVEAHNAIMELCGATSGPFEEVQMETVEPVYAETKAKLQEALEVIISKAAINDNHSNSGSASEEASSVVVGAAIGLSAREKAQIRRRSMVLRIKRISQWSNFEIVPSVQLCNANIELLEQHWNSYLLAQQECVELAESVQRDREMALVTDIEDEFVRTKVAIREAIQVNQNSIMASPNIQRPDVRLPRMELPRFGGTYGEWTSFRDRFVDLIHRDVRMGGAQKLHYLKSCLYGEAEQLTRSYQITDANYENAWMALKNRYDNTRQIVSAHLKVIFDYGPLKHESAQGLRKVADTISENVRVLEGLTPKVNFKDALLVHLLTQKLDNETHRQWELSRGRSELPTLSELMDFVEARCRSIEAIGASSVGRQKTSHPTKKTDTSTSSRAYHTTRTEKCGFCSGDHESQHCSTWINCESSKKIGLLRSRKLCFNCLRTGHLSPKCGSVAGCDKCDRKHHGTLHACFEDRTSQDQSVVNTLMGVDSQMTQQVLLSTARVMIRSATGTYQQCRVLLDSGSQSTFITEDCIQRLGLSRSTYSVPVSGLGQSSVGRTRGLVKVEMESEDGQFQMTVRAMALTRISHNLPNARIDVNKCSTIVGMKLADPGFNVPGPVDMLLGADVYGNIIRDGFVRGDGGAPSAQLTRFGWVLFGPTNVGSTGHSFHAAVNLHAQVGLDDILRKFWELEELENVDLKSEEEKQCERNFEKSFSRSKIDGRYVVQLPFNDEPGQLGHSRSNAVRSLLQMEKRFEKDSAIRNEYVKFMNDFQSLGHMEPAAEQKPDDKSYYMPHLAVVTKKLRVVFDASRKSSNGSSLNSKLLVGPRLQDDLVIIINRFRMKKVAFTTDIVKMYRQIWVHDYHRDYQRIVWRTSPEQPIRDFRIKTVTYGTASAPYLAVRVLKQLASDEGHNYPLAKRILERDFYMDDVMTGGDTEREALEMQGQLISILNSAGMKLGKWASTCGEILRRVPEEDRESRVPVDLDDCGYVKALGLFWFPDADYFSFQVRLSENVPKVTKRSIISEVARLFDPLGLVAPVVVSAKIFMQSLWCKQLDWDEELDSSLAEEWLNFRSELTYLQQIRIQRWVGTSGHGVLEWHGFCDASEKAYCAAIYTRVQYKDGSVITALLTSKTKVAPIKCLSVPRLELCGAHLLSRLWQYIQRTLADVGGEYTLWTDSSVVLAWLQKPPRQWNTFVANRVAGIQTVTSINQWRHVPSGDNPADLGSRGVEPKQLGGSDLWWYGPSWLRQAQDSWPNSGRVEKEDQSELESRSKCLFSEVDDYFQFVERYSSIGKLRRITALLLRFGKNCRPVNRNSRVVGHIRCSELHEALMVLVKMVQVKEFGPELRHCMAGRNLVGSKILSLAPYVDDRGLLRVGGRLQAAVGTGDAKHPYILSNKSHLINLIISDAHICTLHGGVQLTLSTVRQQFWVVGARKAIAKHIRQCIKCIRYGRNAGGHQVMGNLPASRVQPSRVFQHCGVDYAGPLTIRASALRGPKTMKGYVALFVCMATKAIHLELVSSLSTEAFLAAFRRFTARRGKCGTLLSDCGTNFVGAKKELRNLLNAVKRQISDPELVSVLVNEGTELSFIPPGSPWFGGIWESGVKSAKHHLRRIVGDAILTFEEMATVLSQIEACLNSRPICAMSNDPNDLEVLTPGHFIIGTAMNALPDPDVTTLKINKLARWQLVQRTVQHFWKRWQLEYVAALQQRPKWRTASEDCQVGDLVLLMDERFPPASWPMARVTEVHRGGDQKVRVVTVKHRGGTCRRAVRKVCVLPRHTSTDLA